MMMLIGTMLLVGRSVYTQKGTIAVSKDLDLDVSHFFKFEQLINSG